MKAGVWITCRQAHRMISERLDRPLGRRERFRLRLHLMFCAMCARVEQQMDTMRAAVRRLGE